MLATSENTGVIMAVGRDPLHQSSHTTRMRSLDPSRGHRVRDCIERQVHILIEETLELVPNEEAFGSSIARHSLPDNLLLAICGEGLILHTVKIFLVFETFDITLIVMIRCWLLMMGSLMHLVRAGVIFVQNICKASLHQMIIALLERLDLVGINGSGSIECGSDDVLHFVN